MVNDERQKRIVVENILRTPKAKKLDPKLQGKMEMSAKKKGWNGRGAVHLKRDVAIQLNLQNLSLRSGNYATKFTVPSFKSLTFIDK